MRPVKVSPSRPSRRRLGAVLAASSLLLLGGALWLGRKPNVPQVAAVAPATDVRPSVPTFAETSPSEPTVAAKPEGDEGPGRDWLERYQGRSGRLQHAEPPERRYGPVEAESRGDAPTLVVWASPDRVEAGQPLSLTAFVREEGAVIERIEGRWMAPGGPAQPFAWAPRSERSWQASIPTSALPKGRNGEPSPPMQLMVGARVEGTYEGRRFVRQVSTDVFVQHSGARVDPASAKVARRGDDLGLDVAVDVTLPGRYFVSAELWGPDGPIAFARQQLGEVKPGRLDVSLLFGGAVIRSSGQDGPYRVRNLELITVDTIPPHRAPPVGEVATTPSFAAADFR